VRSHAAWALGQLGGASARAALERRRKAEPDLAVGAEIEAALLGQAPPRDPAARRLGK